MKILALLLCIAALPVLAQDEDEMLLLQAATPTGGGGSAITVISTNSYASSTAATSHTVSIPDAIAAGDLIITACVSGYTITVPSGYTEVTNVADYTGAKIAIKTASGSETDIIWTTSNGQAVLGYAVVRNVAAYDKGATTTGQVDSIVAGATDTTTTADQFIFALAGDAQCSHVFNSLTSGYTTIADLCNGGAVASRGVFAFRIVSATGAQSCTFSMSGPGGTHNVGAIATFKQ